LKVSRAVGKGLAVTHKGWPIITVLFVFYGIIRYLAVPKEEIPPYWRNSGDWGLLFILFVFSIVGLSYLWGGVCAFARDGIKEDKYRLKAFLGNCNRYFIRELCLTLIIGVPLWLISVITIALLGGAVSLLDNNMFVSSVLGIASLTLFILCAALAVLSSFSWTITVADDQGILKPIVKSFFFAGERFFRIIGFCVLLFAIIITVSLIAWICYAFVVQGLRRLGLDGSIIVLREIVGCALNGYFLLFMASSFMAYYLNREQYTR
jgi:hypothetical protein